MESEATPITAGRVSDACESSRGFFIGETPAPQKQAHLSHRDRRVVVAHMLFNRKFLSNSFYSRSKKLNSFYEPMLKSAFPSKSDEERKHLKQQVTKWVNTQVKQQLFAQKKQRHRKQPQAAASHPADPEGTSLVEQADRGRWPESPQSLEVAAPDALQLELFMHLFDRQEPGQAIPLQDPSESFEEDSFRSLPLDQMLKEIQEFVCSQNSALSQLNAFKQKLYQRIKAQTGADPTHSLAEQEKLSEAENEIFSELDELLFDVRSQGDSSNLKMRAIADRLEAIYDQQEMLGPSNRSFKAVSGILFSFLEVYAQRTLNKVICLKQRLNQASTGGARLLQDLLHAWLELGRPPH